MQDKILLNSTLYQLTTAEEMAQTLNANDEDWDYIVVDCKNGYGRVDVYDEDGFLLHKGFSA